MEDARSSRWVRGAPVAAVALPIAWAIVAYAMGSHPRPMAAAPRRPALAFAQHMVDLGAVAPAEEVFAHFDFKNRGDETVTVTKLTPSCGCLQPELRKKVYHPGQSGHFLLRVQTANQTPGPKEYHVKVEYQDPLPRETDVVFRVNLAENQVFIKPRALQVYQLSDQPTTQEIDVIDRRPEALRVVRAECTRSDLAKVELLETEVDASGHTHNRIRVTIPSRLPAGRMDAVIRVYTDDATYRLLRVPLVIQTGRQSQLVMKPRAIVDPRVRPAGAESEDEPPE
jgi:Protein of unknown function (DUF1573)